MLLASTARMPLITSPDCAPPRIATELSATPRPPRGRAGSGGAGRGRADLHVPRGVVGVLLTQLVEQPERALGRADRGHRPHQQAQGAGLRYMVV